MTQTSPLRAFKSAAGRVGREAWLLPQVVRPGRSARRVIFFPSMGRLHSGLLRVYNISEQLERLGWRSVVVPPHLGAHQRQRLLRLFSPDVVVLQKCRHRLNRLSHFDGYRVVLDLDDADFYDPKLTDVMERTARGVHAVICGSHFIQAWAQQFTDTAPVVWTGTPVQPGPWPDHERRASVVTWAQADPLAYPAEYAFITELLTDLPKTAAPFSFRLYGWTQGHDHPSLAAFRAAGIAVELVGRLPYEAFLHSLREVSVGLSPIIPQSAFSRGKSFGKVLGYLDAKVPVICSDAADHALFFTPDTGYVSNDLAVWRAALVTLLDDPARRQSMADAAHEAFQAQLSVEVAARRFSAILETTLGLPIAPS